MWVVLAAISCGDPRAYVGPREAPSAAAQVDSVVKPVVAPEVVTPIERVHAPLEPRAPPANARAPERPAFFSRPPRLPGSGPHEASAIVRPRSGRGLLIAGGVLAGLGLATSVGALAAWFRPCSGFCEPYGAVFSSIAAPVPWLLGIGMLGGGMQHRSKMMASRRIAHGRAVEPARRGVFGAGLAMMFIGAGSIVGTWWAPGINAFVQLGGGPLGVAGALMLGHARGRRLALREHVTVTPVITRRTALLSFAVRW